MELEDFSPEEKVRLFDELYSRARACLDESVERGCQPREIQSYLFKAVMHTMFGEQVFVILRSLGPCSGPYTT